MNENQQAIDDIKQQGFSIFPALLDTHFVKNLRVDLDIMYQKRRAVQISNGICDVMEGACHVILGDNNSLDTLLDKMLCDAVMRNYFDGNYILNSY